jgi:hypothetical protein
VYLVTTSKQQLHLKYWQGFIDYMTRHYPEYQHRAPSKESYQIVPPTRVGDRIRIAAGITRGEQNTMRVDLTLINERRDLAKQWFKQLANERSSIVRDVNISDGAKWEWNERPEDPESHIILKKYAPPEERNWEEQYAWMAEGIDRFHQVFGPRIDALSSSS